MWRRSGNRPLVFSGVEKRRGYASSLLMFGCREGAGIGLFGCGEGVGRGPVSLGVEKEKADLFERRVKQGRVFCGV